MSVLVPTDSFRSDSLTADGRTRAR